MLSQLLHFRAGRYSRLSIWNTRKGLFGLVNHQSLPDARGPYSEIRPASLATERPGLNKALNS